MPRTLALIGVGMAGMGYVEAAHRLGYDLHIVELAERRSYYEPHCVGYTPSPGQLDEQWVEGAFRAWFERGPFDAVLGFNDPQALAAALLAERYGLEGPGLAAALVCRNKGLQRGLLAADGVVSQPDFVVCDGVEPIRDRLRTDTARSLVVKPLGAFGSRGVRQIADGDDLTAIGPLDRVIVEEEIRDLAEYSWEAILFGGEVVCSNITRKVTTGPPEFVEVAHFVGDEIDDDTRAQIQAACARAAQVIGIRSGIAHVEVYADAHRSVIVEAAARVPGDAIMQLLEAAYEFDWHELVVQATLGVRPEPPRREPTRCAGSYWVPTPGGTVAEISGLDAVSSHPGVTSAQVSVEVGDDVPPTSWSLERVGSVVFTADDPSRLHELHDWVQRTLHVATKELAHV